MKIKFEIIEVLESKEIEFATILILERFLRKKMLLINATKNSTFFIPNLFRFCSVFRKCSVKSAILGSARNATNVDLTTFCILGKC